jgi:hypothetical protein
MLQQIYSLHYHFTILLVHHLHTVTPRQKLHSNHRGWKCRNSPVKNCSWSPPRDTWHGWQITLSEEGGNVGGVWSPNLHFILMLLMDSIRLPGHHNKVYPSVSRTTLHPYYIKGYLYFTWPIQEFHFCPGYHLFELWRHMLTIDNMQNSKVF